jgi:hypothetical protein
VGNPRQDINPASEGPEKVLTVFAKIRNTRRYKERRKRVTTRNTIPGETPVKYFQVLCRQMPRIAGVQSAQAHVLSDSSKPTLRRAMSQHSVALSFFIRYTLPKGLAHQRTIMGRNGPRRNGSSGNTGSVSILVSVTYTIDYPMEGSTPSSSTMYF